MGNRISRKHKIGTAAILLLSFIPALIWALMRPLSERFADSYSIFSSIGQIFGLTGMAMLSLSFLLNSRLSFLEEYFGGLDKMYLSHHNLGTISFMLLLFHPVILALRFLSSSAKQALFFLLPGRNLAINFGIGTLSLMILLLILTFLVNLKYERWRFTHKFLGLVLVGAIVHMLLIPSDVSRSILLKGYLIGLSGIALISYSYRTLLGKSDRAKLRYHIKEINQLGSEILEIVLKPEGKHIQFIAGQFAFVKFLAEEMPKEQHPFTISSSPKEGQLRFSIKMSGDYTSTLKNLRPGMTAEIEGPYGRFFSVSAGEEVWIAGGIGITPFLSRARDLKNNKQIDLFYSLRNKKDSFFVKELEEIARKNKNFRLHMHYTLEEGHINIKKIKNILRYMIGREVFICGPAGMMTSLKKQFTSEGFDRDHIHMEEFNLK